MSGTLQGGDKQWINAPWARGYGLQPPPSVAHRPAAQLPQTAQSPIFRVRGGAVRVLQLAGKLAVATDATVTNLTLLANPDSGIADGGLANATAIASLGAGTLIAPTVTGFGVAMATGGTVNGLRQGISVDIGTIDLLTSANQAAARAEWLALYEPLHPGATLVPVFPTGLGRGHQTRQAGLRRWTHRAAQVVPATAQSPIFRIQGGMILLWALVGKVVTAFSATATNLTVVSNPTSGLADVNISNATVVTSTAVGNLMSLQANGIGSAIHVGSAVLALSTPLIVDIGTIDLLTSATNPGAVRWAALWEPLHPAGRLIVS